MNANYSSEAGFFFFVVSPLFFSLALLELLVDFLLPVFLLLLELFFFELLLEDFFDFCCSFLRTGSSDRSAGVPPRPERSRYNYRSTGWARADGPAPLRRADSAALVCP